MSKVQAHHSMTPQQLTLLPTVQCESHTGQNCNCKTLNQLIVIKLLTSAFLEMFGSKMFCPPADAHVRTSYH